MGTGELVLTPRLAGEHGFTLLWLVIFGCVIKVFVQVELGRYAIARGVTTLQALDQLPGPRARVSWMLWVWLPVFFAMNCVIGGIFGGTAEIFRLGGVNLSQNALVVLLGLSCSVLLTAGRYRMVEVICTALVAVFIAATLFAVISLQWTDYRITAANLLDGFHFHLPDNFSSVFATFGIIGVGAGELIYYPYWCLEKGYAHRVGPRTPGDAGWLDRARGWLRVMRVDAWTSLIIYTTATVSFYLLGTAILYAKSLRVSNQDMVRTLAQMYLETFGPGGLWIFLLGAFTTLYSTAFAGSAANARLLADAVGLFGLARHNDGGSRARRTRLFCFILPVFATVLYLAWPQPVTLILINGAGQALLLPFLAGAALYFRYRKIDADLRPGRTWTFFLWLSAASLTAVGLWQLIDEIRKRL